MDDFQGLLARDFGLKPQGKSAPMAPPRSSPAGGFTAFSSPPSFGLGSSATDFTRSSSSTGQKSDSVPAFEDHARAGDDLLFNDVFSGPPRHGFSETRARSPPSAPAFDYDAVFKDQNTSKSASMPVYDKPVYDEDIFEGIPGLKSSLGSASARYDDVFASISSSPPKHKKQNSSPFDDLLGSFGAKENEPKKTERVREEKHTSVFDDLIPGFGRSSSPPTNRSTPVKTQSQEASSGTIKKGSNVTDDPFVVFESTSTPAVSSSGGFTDPLEEISKFGSSGNGKAGHSSAEEGVFDDLDPLDSLGKSVPELNKRGLDRSHVRTGSMNGMQSPVGSSESHSPTEATVDDFPDFHHIPSVPVPPTSSSTYANPSPVEANSPVNKTTRSDKDFESADDVWLTVSEIPLFTQPTSAPPPSRPPPPRPARPLKKKVNEPPSFSSSTQYSHSPRSARASARGSAASQIDELEDFATGRTRRSANGYPEVFSAIDSDVNSVAAATAAAMKDAMDKAEAKFRHAREMREKEFLKAARSKEGVQTENNDYQERERQERLERERLERERELERAHEIEKEREEREREHKRIERERIEKERELARQAVERATREARERAAAEARAKAQRAAVEKAAAEARGRAERAAVQRAQAEARERAAVEARERAEKAAAERAVAEAREREARERETRTRAERAAVERAAAEARERAAAQARANQQRNDNDFFSMGSRPSSVPRQRSNSSDPLFDTQNKGGSFDAARTSSGAASNIRKASSTTNIVDDLSSIFGAAVSQSGEFQDVEGESEERRRARLERHQRTQERAAKALAEKNERDLQAQREQAERYRIAETLDVEIKRWAAGKEGNLRAMLSTLQYVLWPECGWQPVSLTDLITAASVKKVYRKATLCIHPDKVQQKGSNLQQKYVAEKVFDLLKEAWNKFNSEELF